MKFWASSETYRPATAATNFARRLVVPFLNAALAGSSLGQLNCTLRYVPIVMPQDMHQRYPARSKLLKKEKIYDCAPILDYSTFVNGGPDDHVREYIRAISIPPEALAALGASQEQLLEFNAILSGAADKIIAMHRQQKLH